MTEPELSAWRLIRKQEELLLMRLGRLEQKIAWLHEDFAGLSVRLDNMDRRVECIERSLDPADAA